MPIGKLLAAGTNGIKLVDGNRIYAEVISTGTGNGKYNVAQAVWNENPANLGGWFNNVINANNDPDQDQTAATNGKTLPDYAGSRHPEDLTRINAIPSTNVINAPDAQGNYVYRNMVGVHIWFDRPIDPQSQFLIVDIDGVHDMNSEITTVFGFNGTALKKPTVTVQLTGENKGRGLQKLSGVQVPSTWNSMINSASGTSSGMDALKTTADANGTGNPIFVFRDPEASMNSAYKGATDPDELSTQALFDFGSQSIDHLFCLWGIAGKIPESEQQNSGLSPFVFNIDLDLGDAPDTYGTLIASDGASHGVDNLLTIGTSLTIDNDGKPATSAAQDSDDGIADGPEILVRKNAEYPVTHIDYSIDVKVKNNLTTGAANRAKMIAWIDWNMNGRFDAAEADSVIVNAATGMKTYTFNWTNKNLSQPFATGNTLYTYMRIRLSTDDALNKTKAKSPMENGDVEDYRVIIRETLILAVSGVELKASLSGNNRTVLNWSTAHEEDNSIFNVQASADATRFTTVGSVEAAGNSNTVKNYFYTHDLDPTNYRGTIYYRIESVDKDGAKTYSNISSVKTDASISVRIYPNPMARNPSIELFTDKATQFKIFVYNTSGQLVVDKTIAVPQGTTTHRLYELDKISEGIYRVKVIDLGSSYTKVFSVSKMR